MHWRLRGSNAISTRSSAQSRCDTLTPSRSGTDMSEVLLSFSESKVRIQYTSHIEKYVIDYIDAFHTNKLKQILYVVHPGFGQDMPA